VNRNSAGGQSRRLVALAIRRPVALAAREPVALAAIKDE
jgi:hypothetical protein